MTDLVGDYFRWLQERQRPKIGHCVAPAQHQWTVNLGSAVATCQRCGAKIATRRLAQLKSPPRAHHDIAVSERLKRFWHDKRN